ncbi:respiratory supercomplex assembly factor RCF1 KNAG_0B03430 [Huiozyma naganishii CBS 8797]|uniref:Respiratory supercomplex factor 1, mitochondrial n=1 Tax=Huiozyma naganishii (strain ATCC MYA-139 / BCRC 22969 / CBS 8797 / KCTC 17520 / NBRC 10181 / NCYC 3082 / Yp74L-3) TaxID=1071383 RepID=J7R1U4_HUIN7|nr:hypothetical protein KNAG_0B03430 [Kazachstania naganishii CBS 8797]CCK68785.1 hypothetical protein KNAG_0B03430 [Kazachstania naganishii CBS 8797]
MSSLPSSFDRTNVELEELSFFERVKFHCKQQPLVPIGALLTTGAVVLAGKHIKGGNQVKAQYYFRWRVVLQGATLVALVAGSFLYGSKYTQKSREDQLREKAKMREQLWIKELERRDEAVKERKKRAESVKAKTQENEGAIRKLESELAELENKLKGDEKK